MERGQKRLGRGLNAMLKARPASADSASTVPGDAVAAEDRPPVGPGASQLADAGVAPAVAASSVEPKTVAVEVETRDENERVVGFLRQVPIGDLSPSPFQPRSRMGEPELSDLAESIATSGILQPLLVRSRVDGGFEIIAGERRWRAAQLAGLASVPVVVRDVRDAEAAQWALVENLQRENLNPVEQARAIGKLIAAFGLSQAEVAQRLGMSRPGVSNQLRVLELEPPILAMVESGALSTGHAKALLSVPASSERLRLAERTVAEQWSVRRLERASSDSRRRDAAEPSGAASGTASGSGGAQPSEGSADRALYEQDLARRLGEYLSTEVRVVGGGGASGRLIVTYFDHSQLEGMLRRIGFEESVWGSVP